MKLRSPISLELVRQGYVRGSKEFKNAYNREHARKRRLNPAFRKQEQEQWKKYYAKKMDQDPEWNALRIKNWRDLNPGEWKALADRATKNGIHKRFYYNHREKLLEEKKEYGRKKRRQEPGFGLRKEISEAKRSGNLGKLIKKLKHEIDKLN